MFKLLSITAFGFVFLASANARPAWLPEHFSIPSRTISPDRNYGIMIPDSEVDAPDKLVEMKTGRLVANLVGEPGWEGGPGPSMRWGDMEADWSADGSTLCWIHPDKWFAASYVVLKLQKGKVAWQVELMKPADREILARTEEAAPLNFAIAKLASVGDGSAYPEGFAIDVTGPGKKFSLPLECDISLTSNCKGSQDVPEENGVLAWLTMRVGQDGTLSYSALKVKKGTLSQDAREKIKAAEVNMPLVDTDMGKALLFPGLISKDARYAVGWTVRPAQKGTPPVDWSHWDRTNPDKLLRLYDWQCYGYQDKLRLPYEVVDFVFDAHTGETAVLQTESPNWMGKKDGWEMIAEWYSGEDGRRYGLVDNAQGDFGTKNFWLVSLSESQMQVKNLTTAMRNAVNGILRERRPEIAAGDFAVSYPIKPGEGEEKEGGLAEVPFVANAPVSDQKEFQLSGTLGIRLSDGAVLGAVSDGKRLDPFLNNEELRKADGELNAIFQAALKSMSPKDTVSFKQKERDWIAQRDADASQAVNIMPYGSTQQASEQARENSLLESTKKRIQELKDLIPVDRRPTP